MTPAAQRVVGIGLILALGALCLPASAALLDGQGTENWIAPVALLAAAAIGAAVTVALPALAREGAATGRRALTGVWWGLLGSVVGLVVFWLLISGLTGA